MKTFFLGVTSLLFTTIVFAQDTVFISMNRKVVIFDEQDYFKSFSSKDSTFLLIRSQFDTIKCFVFKNNHLIVAGNLLIKNLEQKRIAQRDGYWYLIEKGIIKDKLRYVDDKTNSIKWGIPVDKKHLDYNGKLE